MILFENPISKRKVRKGIHAYKYANGCINIEGHKFYFYTMTEAISKWRKNNPIKK
jgi:hypothetical protein